MALESLSYQPEIAEMLSKNYRGEHRFRIGLWKCSGATLLGDWGTVTTSEACSRRGWRVSAAPSGCLRAAGPQRRDRPRGRGLTWPLTP